MTQEFVRVATGVIDAILTSEPAEAMWAGDHRADGDLTDYTASAVAARVEMLHDASDALAQIDPYELDEADHVDHAILTAFVDRDLFELTEVRSHEWNPLLHNPGDLLYALIDRPFAPVEERLLAIRSRLEAVPDALATARAILRDCPQIHLETAAGQFAGTAAMVRREIPRMLAEASSPVLAAIVEPLADRAATELATFGEWLTAESKDERSSRDPRLGRRLWEARLWHTLDTETSASKVFAAAEKHLAEVSDALREAAASYAGGLPNDETVRRALTQLAEDRPDDTTVVARARECLAETTAFVREFELVTVPDDVCEVREMPEHARGVAVAYFDPPGPFETAPIPAFFCIAPTPPGWTPARVESFYREYNNHTLRNLTVHEAMPGHFLQMAHARRYRGATASRALGYSGPFVEGWACYAEEMMADAGYGGLPVRMQQLKMQLRMTINALLDQLVHCENVTEAEAMALMQDKGFQEEGEAAGKWRRALLSSTQLSTYFVGYNEVTAIARARPADSSVQAWHDAMLAHGSPPPRHLRTLLKI